MSLNATKFGLASAVAFAGFWIVCSLLVWVLPSMMMDMTGHMTHGDWSQMGWHLSVGGVLIGLIAWSVVAGLLGWLLATIYNRLL
ncbi:hypothetical protein FCL40_05075 [Ferrimonas sediminicola]|uniref:Uncharacterized protein n=1 Tax=Ferrimonas sediminicola TaxID=2569538 RepID=A0A4U1BHJ0_9GAMM|nr:DUF5676 family membrane protein [Ferrimonas sediminicola]TKB50524.1 hypothetical protein FCL40_05075 [Ferrimonas sediminicola]